MQVYKARYKTGSETEYQLLSTHLEETAMYVELFAKKIGLPKPALLTALSHDLGKNCKPWANYLEENHKNGRKGKKEDHGTAGGQYLYEAIKQKFGDSGEFIAQILAACVMYHHGPGLPDVIKKNGTPQLYERLETSREKTHVDAAVTNLDQSIKERLDAILGDDNFITETMGILRTLTKSKIKQAIYFNLGLTSRFLSSCLIDGDRRSSALFDKGIPVKKEEAVVKIDWKKLLEKLEGRLAEFPAEGKLNEIRRMVSERCAEFAKREDGLYTLSAATGAGKTLASLRYALAHAEATGKDRILYIAPYTSILDQNADVIRDILDPNGINGQIVLEHHSNLEQSEKTEHFIDSSETWNVPIIITTMVQFLEALFGSGTRKIRRMHQLANSVII
ncbi:MAG: CRISPR-associated endonuclease Cas3'', partial [Treponema sp.]|nr:CRISPR-associated endonuclease Cas3'' [Treponema sp.]